MQLENYIVGQSNNFFFFGGGGGWGLETYEQKKRTSLICFPSISKTDLGKLKRWGLFP